jgi:hypothetical protein
MKADHVVLNSETGDFECRHCGQTYKPTLPAPMGMFAAMCREYAKAHQFCVPREWKLNEPTHLRNLPAGQRFVLVRTGQVFTLIGRQLDKGHTRIIVQQDGESRQSTLSHQCIVRPFADQAETISPKETAITAS